MTSDEHRRRVTGRIRPISAVCAIAALGLGVAAVAYGPVAEPTASTTGSTQARSGPGDVYCPGPLEAGESALSAGGDEDLSVVGPSPDAAVTAVSLEQDSALLYGQETASETQRDEIDGSVRVPWIEGFDLNGSRLSGDDGQSDLGLAVLRMEPSPDSAEIVSGTAQDGTPVLDVAQTTLTPSGDFRSLTATRCQAPASSATFLGASTQRGSSAVLVLRNTGSRAATANVQVWTPDGPASMQGRSRVVVPGGETEEVLLESIAPGHDAVATQVDVLGAPLVMTMRTMSREGLAPRGAEILGSLPAPASSQTITGVHVTGSSARLTLLNPQRTETTVRATVIGPDGEVPDASTETTVAAGSVETVDLTGLDPANYSIVVEADAPVGATARIGITGPRLPGLSIGRPIARATVAPAPSLDSGTVLAIPPLSTDGRLVLTAEEDAEVRIIPVDAEGTAGEGVDVTVRGGTTLTRQRGDIDVDEDTTALIVVPTDGDVNAAWVHLHDDGQGANLVSVLPVRPPTVPTAGVSVALEP